MKNILLRFLLAFICLPVLIFLILWEQFDHIGLVSIFIISSGLATYEMTRILEKLKIKVNITLSIFISIMVPLVFWLTGNNRLPKDLVLPEISKKIVILFSITAILIKEILKTKKTDWETTIPSIAGSSLLIFYPAWFITFLIQICKLNLSSFIFLLLFLLVFVNDAFAYFSGMLFGKKSWKPFSVSPNKSIVGFMGGFIFTIGTSLLYFYFKPELFGNKIYHSVILAIIIAITANSGDLIESSIKRSAGIKDSGKLMLGRGGILDSIDSIIFSAPFLFLYYQYLIETGL